MISFRMAYIVRKFDLPKESLLNNWRWSEVFGGSFL